MIGIISYYIIMAKILIFIFCVYIYTSYLNFLYTSFNI